MGQQIRRLSGFAYYDGVAMGVPTDGVSDCATAINDALSEIGLAGGGVLFLRAGTYILNDRLSPPSNTVIQGVPNETTIKTTATSLASSAQIIRWTSVSNVGLRDIIVDGNASALTLFLNNVQLFDVQNALIENVRFQNMKGIGVLASTNIRNLRVAGCEFVDCGVFPTFGPGGGRQALAFVETTVGNSYNNSVVDCSFSNVGLDSIAFQQQVRGVVANNRATSVGAGLVYVYQSKFVTVTGNVCRSGATGASPYANGIDCAGSESVSIVGNTMYENGGCGILVSRSDNVSVAGNVCINNNQDASSVHRAGIVVGADCDYVAITGNVCTDNQGVKTQQYGLVIDPTATNVVIGTDNVFTGNKDGDISSTDYDADASIETPVTYVSPYVSINGVVPGFEAKGTATDIDVQLKPKGSGAVDIANGALEMAGTAVINSSRHPVLRSYAKASLPAATTAAQLIYVTDDTGGATPAFSDGTNWRRVADRAVIS